MRLYKTNSNCPRPIQIVQDQFNLSNTNSNCPRPIQIVQDQFKLSKTNSNCPRPIQLVQDQFKLSKTGQFKLPLNQLKLRTTIHPKNTNTMYYAKSTWENLCLSHKNELYATYYMHVGIMSY